MESNLSLIGTRSSGKTTCAGLLYMTAVDLSLRGGLRVRTKQRSLDILKITAGLQKGQFPPPNPTGQYFQADVTLEFGRWPWAKHRVNLALVDVAGEELRPIMSGLSESSPFASGDDKDVSEVNRYLLNSTGFILIADLAKALGREAEAQGIGYTDAALAQYVSELFDYKKKNTHSPPFRGIAIVLTKYDMVERDLGSKNMALTDKKSFLSFMERSLSLTYAALHGNTDINRVEFFCSGLELSRQRPAAIAGVTSEGPLDSTPALAQITIDDTVGRPKYTRDKYEQLLRWIEHTFARGE